MCGLAASFGAGPRDETAALRAALSAMAHRGPDGEGWVSLAGGQAWLGHRRLALIDRTGGTQPLANEDGSVWVVVNGEVYGDERLRRDLEARGHRLRTRSDSEILVHLYEEQGAGMLDGLVGEFAFVLFDQRAGRILAGRDRFGIKPLLWAEQGGRLLFASEAKGLFALGVRPEWDLHGVFHTVAHQYLPPARTLFQGITALPPGCGFAASLGAPGRVFRYHRLSVPASLAPADPRAARDEVRAHLTTAVNQRLRAEVPVGVYLSGGVDSAAVLALAAAAPAPGPAALRAFGVVFDVAPYDEGAAAQAMAAHVGVPFTPVPVSQADLVTGLPAAVRFAEGLAINGQLVAKHHLARAARAGGVVAVLTGEGADEAFLGYPHLRLDYLGAAAERAEDGITRGLMIPGAGPLPALAPVAARLGFVPTFLQAKAAFGERLAALLHPGVRSGLPGVFDRLLDALGETEPLPDPAAAPVTVAAWLWTRLALAGYILRTLGDGTEMAAGIEGRTPFLDHRLFACALRLPVALRIAAGGREKAVLRDAVADLLPPEVTARPKQPFLAPPVLAGGGQFAAARDLLLEAIPYAPFFDAGAVRAWIDGLAGADAPTRGAAEPVWTLLTTAGLLGRELGLGYRGSMA